MKPDEKIDEQPPPPVTQLLLIDDPESCGELKQALEKAGFGVRVAKDGGQARSLAATYKPDMLLLELALPRESGYELCDFFKKKDEGVPILVLTEVDLDASRNLAIWCGADGYLVKPVSIKTLVSMVREVSEAVWRRMRAGAQSIDGRLEFPCGCGQKVAVDVAMAGKATFCPRCSSRIMIPKNVNNWEGFWKSSGDKGNESNAAPQKAEQAGEGESDHLADFFCQKCGSMVQLRDYTGGRKIPCGECGEPHTVPERILTQIKFFFRPREKELNVIRFNPTRGISLRCQDCRELFSVNAEELRRGKIVCSTCHKPQRSPSIRESPLSRAALVATGRLFMMTSGDHKGMKFLLPPEGVVKIGSAPGSALHLPYPGVSPVHCAMRYTRQGPQLQDAGSQSGTFVNEYRVQKALLQPGDEIRIGPVRLRLSGNRTFDEDAVFRASKKKDEPQPAQGTGTTKIGDQAARVLQLHWERQRESIKNRAEPVAPAPAKATAPNTPATVSPSPSAASSPQTPITGLAHDVTTSGYFGLPGFGASAWSDARAATPLPDPYAGMTPEMVAWYQQLMALDVPSVLAMQQAGTWPWPAEYTQWPVDEHGQPYPWPQQYPYYYDAQSQQYFDPTTQQYYYDPNAAHPNTPQPPHA